MATYDLTDSGTVGVSSNSIAALPGHLQRGNGYLVQKVFDISKIIADGYTYASGDVWQLLELPADTMVLFAGAKVETAFDGTSPVVDIDFGGGDDVVDGASLASTGWLASGTNGKAMTVDTGAASTFTELQSAADTIDLTISSGAADVTEGVIRVVAFCVDVSAAGNGTVPTEVTRDQLA